MSEEFHPIANLFPLMSKAELQELAADIKENGQRYKIWRHKDGRIVDGRNRWLACKIAGVECREEVYAQDDDTLLKHVIGFNMMRRHLSESQRAMVAARIATLPAHRPTISRPIGPLTEPVENKGISEPEAAKMLNVGVTSVKRGRAVLEQGTPDMIAAVDQGALSVSKAADQIANAKLGEKAAKGGANQPAAAGKRKPGPAKGGKKPGGKKPAKATASPVLERPPELTRFSLWLRNGAEEVLKDAGPPHEILSLAMRHGIFVDLGHVQRIADFMTALIAAMDADRAA